jgi:predicted nucleic acid-binding protein
LGGKAKGKKRVTRIVVCDTGPLLHLSEAGCIHLLPHAGDILIPLEVAEEFSNNAPILRLPEWIQVISLSSSALMQANSLLNDEIDPGEAEAIILAQEVHADWLLTDDGRARRFAELKGMEVHGSIGLLLWAAANQHIETRNEAHRLLTCLSESSLWISENILYKARQAIDAMYQE